ncbi:MAG TPA: NUDIX domain-containing protein [Thermoleophilaceae bacterium]|nr:NUDIX domain-containing protein [Thermoleophilaceae bacterium]
MSAEFSAGGVALRRFRGRPFTAVILTPGGALALPKGHPDAGESAAAAAVREVREEAGIETTVVEKLDDVRYFYFRDGSRRLKIVRFFLLRYRAGSVRDHDHEVQEARWLPLEDAPHRLTYPGERDVAARALSVASR